MTARDDSFDIVRHSTKWNFVRSNVIPSNVTITSRLAVGSTTTSRPELRGSALRPAINPAAWYESPDRSKPSVSSF
ncbi:MAG TPA: hypothetical protein VH250_01500 [Granulicella sp.]|jgi:hypothetical protein|nr:hypothetical protein [Granulicella sp.]